MISKKMLSLLTAVVVSGGAATTAVIAPAVIASEQTMAERYQPGYDQETYRAVPSHFFPVRSDGALPSGTKFSLVDSGSLDFISHGAVMVAMRSSDGELHVWFNSLHTPNPGVSTVPVRVAAYYPDGSSEIFVSNVSVTPEDTHVYDIHYPSLEVRAGTVASANPSTNHRGYPVPTGTRFAMTGYQEVHDRRAEGWVIEVDSASGELTVAAPEGVEGSVEIPLSVTYPDGSQDTTWAKAWAFKPHADAYDIAFDTVTIDAGATFYAQPNNIEHPVDTTVTLVPSQELESLQEDGWTIEGDTGIGFFITAPRTATTGAQLPLTVTYPDGTTEPTSITITVFGTCFQ
ncbi:Rib/alpha-like domain-containing protein [Corynebacterium sanguinis]